MVHPAAFAVTLGIGLGAAIFLLYFSLTRDGSSRQYERAHRNRPRDPLDAIEFNIK